MFTFRALHVLLCALFERAIAASVRSEIRGTPCSAFTLAFAMGLLASHATASPIVIQIRGIISSVDDEYDILSPQVASGATFTAILACDTNILDSDPDDRIGRFEDAPALSSLLIDLNGMQLTTAETGASPSIRVTNNAPYGYTFDWTLPPPADAFEMWTSSVLSGVDTFKVSTSMYLVDYSTLAFNSAQLPAALDLAAFDRIDFSVWGYRIEGGQFAKTFKVRLAPESFTFVPEPSSFAFAGIGALGLLAYGVRRRFTA